MKERNQGSSLEHLSKYQVDKKDNICLILFLVGGERHLGEILLLSSMV